MKVRSNFNVLAIVAIGGIIFCGRLSAQDAESRRPHLYPHDVTEGGQLAVIEGNPEYAIFAKVQGTVSSGAAVLHEAGPGRAREETMELVKEGEHWYLSQF